MIAIEIVLTSNHTILIAVAILFLSLIILGRLDTIQREKRNAQSEIQSLKLKLVASESEFKNLHASTKSEIEKMEAVMQKTISEHLLQSQQEAAAKFEQYKSNELQKETKKIQELSQKAALLMLEEWKRAKELEIRKDAINKSYSVTLGKVSEHLFPFSDDFLSKFNPQDARFLGSPIDLIIFDGMNNHNEEIEIFIAEIKTGKSRLTTLQKRVKQAVLNSRIGWVEINPDLEPSMNIFYPISKENSQKEESYEFDTIPRSISDWSFDNHNKTEKSFYDLEIDKLNDYANKLIEEETVSYQEVKEKILIHPSYQFLLSNTDFDTDSFFDLLQLKYNSRSQI